MKIIPVRSVMSMVNIAILFIKMKTHGVVLMQALQD